MIIKFLLILLLYEIIGDSILQLDRIIFKRKIDRFTLLEQFIFSLILGLLINSLFNIIILFIGPFDYILLLFFNFIFLIIFFLINQRSFSGFFYCRVYKKLKNKKKFNNNGQYFRKFLFFFIGIIILDIYISSFSHELSFLDIFNHAHYALDFIKNGYYNYNSLDLYNLFFIDNRIASRLFIFILVPFYAMDPSEWLFISGIFLSKLQFYLFYALVFIILYRIDPKFNIIIVFFLSAATVIFPSWFVYFLPCNFTIIPFIALLIFLFNKEIKSLFIELFLFFFVIILHIPSILFIFLMPLILTILINWIFEPSILFHNYQERKNKIITYFRKNRWKFLLTFSIIIICIIILIIFNSSFITDSIDIYFELAADIDVNFYPPIQLWKNFTIGLGLNIILLSSFLYLFINEKIKKKKYLVLFFFLLNIYLTIYLLNFEFWNNIIKTLYSEYRFILYLDISLIILFPILISIITKNTQFLKKEEFYIKEKLKSIKNYVEHFKINDLTLHNKIYLFFKKNKKTLHRYLNFSNLANAIIIFSLLFYCLIKIIPNYHERYYRDSFEDLSLKSHYYTLGFLEEYALNYQTYMYNPSFSWNIIHSYLYELRCIDYKQMSPYYDDGKYEANNSEYQDFLNFVFNETKVIYYKQATYKYDYLRFTKRVDYVVIDSFSNPNLSDLMYNDTVHFKKIFKCYFSHPVIILISLLKDIDLPQIFIFKPIGNI